MHSQKHSQGNTSQEPLISAEPLLKPATPQNSAIIIRSTAEHFPLPSVVPGAQIKTIPTAQAAEVPAAVVPATKIVETQPVTERPSSSHRSKSGKHAILREKPTESWAESLTQRVLSTLGHSRQSRTSGSGIKPALNRAEVSYDPQGKVDYVTYTVNAPQKKFRGRTG